MHRSSARACPSLQRAHVDASSHWSHPSGQAWHEVPETKKPTGQWRHSLVVWLQNGHVGSHWKQAASETKKPTSQREHLLSSSHSTQCSASHDRHAPPTSVWAPSQRVHRRSLAAHSTQPGIVEHGKHVWLMGKKSLAQRRQLVAVHTSQSGSQGRHAPFWRKNPSSHSAHSSRTELHVRQWGTVHAACHYGGDRRTHSPPCGKKFSSQTVQVVASVQWTQCGRAEQPAGEARATTNSDRSRRPGRSPLHRRCRCATSWRTLDSWRCRTLRVTRETADQHTRR